MSKTKIIFRADGNSAIGLGHVVRSLALAEMLRNEFACVFAIQGPDARITAEIKSTCEEVIALPLCASADKSFPLELDPHLTGHEIVVLDGYAFDTGYQRHIKSKGHTLVCIDDIHAYHFVADAIINHIPGIQKKEYSCEPYTECYFGPQYALLRPAFFKSQAKTNAKSTKQVLINMGGADPYNQTCDVINEIGRSDFFAAIHVVTGSAYQHKDKLQTIIERDKRIVHAHAIDASQMASLMQICGTCVCSPSSVSLEYISLGGVLFLRQTADNQEQLKTYLIGHGLAFEFDRDFQRLLASGLEALDREIMSRQSKFIDGRSTERLRGVFHQLDLPGSLSLRPARMEDMKTCYHWANDPEVRKASYQSTPIPWKDHVAWFTNKINSTLAVFYIVEHKGKPIGQIRFDGKDERVISYLISPEMRGKGLGSPVLQKAVSQLVKDASGVRKIVGYVKRSNVPSCKAFEKAGFAKAGDTNLPYPDSVRYELRVPTDGADSTDANEQDLPIHGCKAAMK